MIIDYKERAIDEAKKGGDIERAKVYAMLALAQAIEANTQGLTRGLADIGSENWPLHVQGG